MSVLYADASALFKLVRKEAESSALHADVEGADLVSSEQVVAELPRALQRAAAIDLRPIDVFVTYDHRQAAAARLAGLRTVAPGA